jgi:hypothetical protein
MVACEQGYLCDVCGKDVEAIIDSDLYLRYIMGEVPPLALPNMRERHIRCNLATAQYIVDAAFEPLKCEGVFDKAAMVPEYVAQQEELVTRAWRRLQEVPRLGVPLTEYPLEEVRERWKRPAL